MLADLVSQLLCEVSIITNFSDEGTRPGDEITFSQDDTVDEWHSGFKASNMEAESVLVTTLPVILLVYQNHLRSLLGPATEQAWSETQLLSFSNKFQGAAAARDCTSHCLLSSLSWGWQ